MKINKGLNLDNHPSNLETGTWIWAKNILYKRGYLTPCNEPGFTGGTTTEFTIIGVISTPKEAIIFSQGTGGATEGSAGTIPFFKIEKLDINGRTTILRTRYITFNKGCVIKGVYKYNYKGELIIVWSNGVEDYSSKICLLNIDDISILGGLNANFELSTSTYVTNMYLFPDAIVPNMDLYLYESTGGGIKSGVHFLALSYVYPYHDISNCIQISRPIIGQLKKDEFVYDAGGANPTSSFTQIVDDSVTGDKTPKSVTINLNGLDTRFDHYKMYVIHKMDGLYTAEDLGTFPTNKTLFTYSGQSGITVDISDITVDDIFIDKCKGLANVNGALVFGNIRNSEINIQKYVNNIKVRYTSSAVVGYYAPDNVYNYKCPMTDEVYALYLRVVKKNGERSNWYHIPGRDMDTFNEDSSTVDGGGGAGTTFNEDVLLTDMAGGGTCSPSTEELAINTTVKYFQVRDTSGVHSDNGAVGRMGFWYNENEFYNQNIEDTEVWDVTSGVGHRLAGSRNGVDAYLKLQDKKYQTGDAGDSGAPVNVMHHKMPSGYHIGAGNYKYAINLSDIKFPDEIEAEIQGFEIGYAVRDFEDISVLGFSPLLANAWEQAAGARTADNCRFYDYGLLTTKPNIIPNYIKARLLTRAAVTGVANIPNQDLSNVVGQRVFNDAVDNVNNAYYFKADDSSTPYYANTGKEETLFFVLGSGQLTDNNGLPVENYYIGAAYKYMKNVFVNYYDQTVADTARFHPTDGSNSYSVSNLFGFDSIFTTQGTAIYNPTSTNASFFKFYYPSIYNVELRKKDVTKYWKEYTLLDAPYSSYYNFDYSSINNFKLTGCYNPTFEYQYKLPFTLYKTIVGINETVNTNWRTILADSYKILPNGKGYIYNLEVLDKTLIAEMLYTRYALSIKSLMATDEITAYLRDSDLFEEEPTEIVNTDKGYSGNTSCLGTAITPYGLATIDRNIGKVFLFDGKLNDLTANSVSNYLYENLNTNSNYPTLDNPYIGIGINLGYDRENDRLLLTKRNYTTLTYVPQATISLPSGDYTTTDIETATEYQGTLTAAVDYSDGDIVKYDGKYYIIEAGIAAPNYYLPTSITAASFGFTVAGGDGCAVLILLSTEEYTGNPYYYTYTTSNFFTLSYSFEKKQWVAFHDYYPNHYFYTQFGNFAVGNNLDGSYGAATAYIKAMNNKGFPGQYYGLTVNTSVIDIVMNAIEQVISWDSITWKTIVNDYDNNVLPYDETIDDLAIYNDDQCTGYLTINLQDKDWFDTEQGVEKFKTYTLNQIRDAVINNKNPIILDDKSLYVANIDATSKDWYELSKIISTYIVIRIRYDNIATGDPRLIIFSDIKANGVLSNLK